MALFKKSFLTVSSVAFRSPLLSVQSLTVCGLLRNRETMCWQCLQLKRFALSLVFNTVQPWNGISISTWPGYFRLDGWHFFLSQAQIHVYEMHTIRCVRVCTCLGRLMSSGCCSTTPLHCSTIIYPSVLIFTSCQDETVGSWTVRSGTEISLTHQVFKSFSQNQPNVWVHKVQKIFFSPMKSDSTCVS